MGLTWVSTSSNEGPLQDTHPTVDPALRLWQVGQCLGLRPLSVGPVDEDLLTPRYDQDILFFWMNTQGRNLYQSI